MEESAGNLYGLTKKQFMDELTNYIDTGNIINDVPPNIENAAPIKFNQQEFRKATEEYYKEKHGNKPHCTICGDTKDENILIKIKNADKILCKECIDLQKNMHGVKFSKIINNNGKLFAYIKK
jgi:hypothetical protein